MVRQNSENNEETDRTFTYIYTHPDSYEPLAQCYKESENAQHTVNYFHCDQIGVPREMTDSQGKLIWKGRYDAWGQLIHDSNRHAQRTTHQPFRLQNQYFDQETGLHYNFLRYYEPALGRFITQDPIGLMGGMNLYRFEGTVQNQVDPLGLMVQMIAASWLLEALAHATAAMTGILIGVGIMEAAEAMEATEEEDKAEVQETEASKCEKERKKRCKKWGVGTPIQAQLKVRRQQAPRGIDRIDRGHGNAPNAQWHAHDFTDAALNVDGTIHDKHRGAPSFGKDERDFLFCHGWNI